MEKSNYDFCVACISFIYFCTFLVQINFPNDSRLSKERKNKNHPYAQIYNYRRWQNDSCRDVDVLMMIYGFCIIMCVRFDDTCSFCSVT